MSDLVQKYITGTTAVKICESIECAVCSGHLVPGQKLPTVRELAATLGISPATVAAAYQALQARGMLVARGRRGTCVSHRAPCGPRPPVSAPPGTRNLYDGNPDPALLPDFAAALSGIDTSPRLYGDAPQHGPLVKWVSRRFTSIGIDGSEVSIVSGAMDGIERVLGEHTRPGDVVALEDPGYWNVYDVVQSRGLAPISVMIDEEGIVPDELARACQRGIKALICTPRAQNPTGAAISAERASDLQRILKKYPEVLIIHDDHAGLITEAPLNPLHRGHHGPWAYIQSFSKALNPDLRLAAITGDSSTMQRLRDRLIVGERWVSHILQRLAHALLSDATIRKHLQHVARTYRRRQQALIDALAHHGLEATGSSGYNIWLPAPEETSLVQSLAAQGWGVCPGERFRINASPAIRITASTLEPDDAESLASHIATDLQRRPHISSV